MEMWKVAMFTSIWLEKLELNILSLNKTMFDLVYIIKQKGQPFNNFLLLFSKAT